jgi:hypothetical protein
LTARRCGLYRCGLNRFADGDDVGNRRPELDKETSQEQAARNYKRGS